MIHNTVYKVVVVKGRKQLSISSLVTETGLPVLSYAIGRKTVGQYPLLVFTDYQVAKAFAELLAIDWSSPDRQTTTLVLECRSDQPKPCYTVLDVSCGKVCAWLDAFWNQHKRLPLFARSAPGGSYTVSWVEPIRKVVKYTSVLGIPREEKYQ